MKILVCLSFLLFIIVNIHLESMAFDNFNNTDSNKLNEIVSRKEDISKNSIESLNNPPPLNLEIPSTIIEIHSPTNPPHENYSNNTLTENSSPIFQIDNNSPNSPLNDELSENSVDFRECDATKDFGSTNPHLCKKRYKVTLSTPPIIIDTPSNGTLHLEGSVESTPERKSPGIGLKFELPLE